jgi:hypothetical protein
LIKTRRRFAGILSYVTAFFPSLVEAERLRASINAFSLARLFWLDRQLPPANRLVRCDESATVCLNLQQPAEKLWEDISKNGRHEIRSMMRAGERVRIVANTPEVRRDFLVLYNAFARAKADIRPISRHVLARYGAYADVTVAYLDDLPMCTHVHLRDASIGRARLIYSAGRRLEEPKLAQLCGKLNRMLHWHSIMAYRDRGFSIYDFGGISRDPNNGIARFKQSFGGDVVREFTYWCAGSSLTKAALRGYFALRNAKDSASSDAADPATIDSEAHDAV